ncbi:FxsA family protein [Shouchella sp. 1P09AA]|uniref:FxsA family protein n=1 Tax=Bacillaceae TaxID=186817 RepID=UPI000C078F3D|nr:MULTISPECIES: FxsA family protein [Bacillaceae]UTR05285.1 FxsA family protein [Alkalihalobacillus sp. LMS6]
MLKRLLFPIAIGVPLIELLLIVLSVQWIGVWYTILAMLTTSIVGFLFARRQGMQVLRLAQLQMQKQQVPSQALIDGACIFIGGALLMLPGFFLDVVGAFFLIPWTRGIIKAGLLKAIHTGIAKGQFIVIKRR